MALVELFFFFFFFFFKKCLSPQGMQDLRMILYTGPKLVTGVSKQTKVRGLGSLSLLFPIPSAFPRDR